MSNTEEGTTSLTYPVNEIIKEDKKIDMVNHPPHYGGENNTYEVINVIEAWNLNFNLGSAIKYIGRAGKKDDIIQDLNKALWYVKREIKRLGGTPT